MRSNLLALLEECSTLVALLAKRSNLFALLAENLNHLTTPPFFICHSFYFYLPSFLLLSATFFSFICRPFSTSLSDRLSPRAKLQESARHTTRVRTPNDSSPSAVGTRVLKRNESTRTITIPLKTNEINHLSHQSPYVTSKHLANSFMPRTNTDRLGISFAEEERPC